MKLIDIMIYNINSNYSFNLNMNLTVDEVNIDDYDQSEFIGVTNDNEEIVGEISTAKLRFIKKNMSTWNVAMVLENIDEGVIAMDINGVIFYVNKTYSAILGVPRSKVLGKLIYDIESGASIIKVLETGKPLFKNNQHIISVDKYVSVKIFPIYNNEKIVIGAYSIFNDITEIKNLNREVIRINNVADEYSRQNEAHKELRKLNVIGEDRRYLNLIYKTMIVAPTDVSVLIRGDNGVGKEIFAKLVHRNSLRKDTPLVSVNCAAIPENLIESELFGYEEGAFTGASKKGKIGKFKLADRGTLFLDEIGDMPLMLQSKLLRVLQEGEIEPIGGKEAVKVDVRIIAATNQPLEKMIEEKLFRKDLYYRLNAITFFVPALQERGNDVILLANFFLNKFNKEYNKDLVISREVYNLFLSYNWPGNVRELINCLKFSVLLCSTNMIQIEDLPLNMGDFISKNKIDKKIKLNNLNENLSESIKEFEKKIILDTIEMCHGDKKEAIEKLGISRRSFYRKLQQYN